MSCVRRAEWEVVAVDAAFDVLLVMFCHPPTFEVHEYVAQQRASPLNRSYKGVRSQAPATLGSE